MEPVLQTAASTDIDQLATHIRQLASGKQLGVVPGIPSRNRGPDLVVLLNDGHLSAADFCELAAIAGTRLLYIEAKNFDAASDSDLDIGEHIRIDSTGRLSSQVAALYRDAQRFNGRIRELEMAFVTGGVLHCWAVAADWYDGLLERAAGLVLDEELAADYSSGADLWPLSEPRFPGESPRGHVRRFNRCEEQGRGGS